MGTENLCITLIEVNGGQLGMAEQLLRRQLRRHGLHAKILCLACGLEIARRGMANSAPAILVDEQVFSQGRPLTPELLEELCQAILKKEAGTE